MIITVFDFDDTIFPTSYYYEWKDKNRKKEKRVCYPRLSNIILNLIRTARDLSDQVYIISNASRSWIEHCVKDVLLDCDSILKKVNIVSTIDDNYDQLLYRNWKMHAFTEELAELLKEGGMLVACGDCAYDRLAALSMKTEQTKVKNIKFIEKPNLKQLMDQQRLLKKCFPIIFKHHNDLDLVMSCKNNKILLGPMNKNK